jgi:hypothetical protein
MVERHPGLDPRDQGGRRGLTGKNPAATGYLVGLDYLDLVPST